MSIIRTAPMARDEGLEIVRRWAITRTPSLHKSFAASAQLENQRAEFRLTTNHDLRQHTDRFYEVMEIYRKNAKEKALLNFNIRDQHSWDEVIRTAKDAEQKYNNKAKGPRGIGHKAARFVGDHAADTSPWLELLPNGEYTSVLCGGLKFVFVVAGRMSEKRQRVLEALGDVPGTIDTVEKYLENFHSDQTLSDLIIELYVLILRAIEGIMQWLVDKAVWSQIKAMLLGPSYDKPLDEMIVDVKAQLQAVEQRIGFLRDQDITRTRATTADMNSSVRNIRSDLNDLKESHHMHSTMVLNKVDKLHSRIDSSKGMVEHLYDTLCNAEWVREKEEWEKERAEWEREKERLSRQLEETRALVYRPKTLISQQQLVNILAVDPERAVHDSQLTIRQGMSLDPSSHGSAYTLLRNLNFEIWLKSGETRVLLVDGNSPSALASRTSPISLICATLVQSLADVQPVICVHFFCGLHTSWNDPLSGPMGLMRSLISQLLFIQNFDLSFINSRIHRDQIYAYDLEHLCELFQTLLHQISIDTVVFCVIDGVSLYERSERMEETCFVVDKLREITESPALNAIFKLLLTSPGRSRYIKNYIAKKDQLVLPQDAGEMPVLTRRRIAMQLRRPLMIQRSTPNLNQQHPFQRYQDSDPDTEDDDFDNGNLSD